MAAALDAIMTAGNGFNGNDQTIGAATSISSTGMTVGASGSLILVPFVFAIGGITSPVVASLAVTWNGVTVNLGPTITANDGVNSIQSYIAYLPNPATGNRTLAASWVGTADCYMGCASFTGTDTVTGIKVADNTTTSAANNLTITSSTDGATFAVAANNNGKPTLSQTLVFVDDPNIPGGGASYALAGGSVNHSFTGGTAWAISGVHILGSGAGAVLGLMTMGAG